MSAEAWWFLLFIGLIIQDYSFKKYLIVLAIIGIGWYLINGNIIRSLWLVFLATFLFNTIAYALITPDRLVPEISGILHQMEFNYVIYFYDFFLILLIIFLKIRGIKSKYKWGWRDFWLLMVTLSAVIITIKMGDYYQYAWYSLMIWFKYVVIFYVTIAAMSDRKNIKPTLEVMAVFIIFEILLVITQKFHGGPWGLAVEDLSGRFNQYAVEIQDWYRPGGTTWNANLTSSIMVMAFPVVNWLIIKNDYLRQRWWWFWGMFLTALVFMGSRYVWVIFAVAAWQLYHRYYKNDKKITKWWWLAAILMGPLIIQRMYSLVGSLGFDYRINHWKLTAEILGRRPGGIGLDIFKYEIIRQFDPAKYFYDPSPPHNLFLEVFSGVGVIGGTAYLIWVVEVLREMIKRASKSEINYLLTVSTITYFLVNQMYSSLFSDTITGLFWIILGIFYAKNFTREDR